MFEKLDKTSVKDKALRALEAKLLSGEYQAGDRLPPERDIAEAMGVSRGIVSMCMLELEEAGFVTCVPRQGTFVTDYRRNGTPAILYALMNYEAAHMDHTLFDSMMATRLHIECECARLAAGRAAPEELDELEALLAKMRADRDTDAFLHDCFAFHHALSGASGNAVYAMIVKSFERAILYFQRLAYEKPGAREASLTRHGTLLSALRAGDERAAMDAMREILLVGVDALAKIYK